ncbi:helix-turn-helix domain-containing protein [Virgibacillus siamensis]|uniref:helix-turn-helix domain-containing protein n=1 Tax=Virgibacillus siamensis TaxID=480071 RepID=UPI000987298B|nr:helix-turn-helix transcriptional regulator [Virgibacillus siamensis]
MEKPINQYYIQMGKYVKNKRNSLDMKQAELAEYAGLSDRYISKLENGKKRPLFETLHKICIALEIDVNDLMDYLYQYKECLYDDE